MRRVLNKLSGATGGVALCAGGLIAVAAPQPAYASDWGCQVVLWNALAMGGGFPSCTGVGIKTKSAKHGYTMTVTQPDGSTSHYSLDTRYQTVTQQ